MGRVAGASGVWGKPGSARNRVKQAEEATVRVSGQGILWLETDVEWSGTKGTRNAVRKRIDKAGSKR